MQHQHAAAQLHHVAKFGTHWSAARWCKMDKTVCADFSASFAMFSQPEASFFSDFFFLPLDQAHLELSQTALKIVEQAFIQKLCKFGLKEQNQCLSFWLLQLPCLTFS